MRPRRIPAGASRAALMTRFTHWTPPARLKAEQGDIDEAQTLLRVADARATGIPHLIDEADLIDAHHVRTPTPP
jgi:hypothetical protein